MYTPALTSAHEYMVAYKVMTECRANSLLRDALGTRAIGWLPQPSARFSGQIGTVWKFSQRVECRFKIQGSPAQTWSQLWLNLACERATCNSIYRPNNE
jgi:hypothetical protein